MSLPRLPIALFATLALLLALPAIAATKVKATEIGRAHV